MLLEIVKYPDPRLKRVAEPIAEITDHIRELAANMAETMYAAPGVGLAAPQVGESVRLIVIDASGPEERQDLRILINPELTLLGEEIVSEGEGCLSVPLNYRADVKRHDKVLLKARNLEGEAIEEEWEDFAAIVLQHECDHLQGTLFIDHISRLRRTLYDAKVKKCQKRACE